MTDEFKSKVALESQKYKTSEEIDVFEEGVVFGLNAIWHEASEEPVKFPCKILAIEHNGIYTHEVFDRKKDYLLAVKAWDLRRWCYLEDLL